MTSVLHVSGLGWSGSGAVLDALLDADQFLSLKGKTQSVSESRLFSGSPAIPDLVVRLPSLSAPDLLALWTAGQRVHAGTRLSREVRRFLHRTTASHGVNGKVFSTVPDDALHRAAEVATARIVATTPGSARLTTYLAATYEAMRTLLGGSGRPLLIDNDPGITPRISEHLRADADVRFVTVIRSPSDQYVDKRAKADATSPVVLNLTRTALSGLRRRRDLQALAATAAAWPDRVIVVPFERFVTDDAYRARLLDRTVPGRRTPEDTVAAEGPRFVATRSARNVGLRPASRDRVAHASYVRLCDGPHQRVMHHSGPPDRPVLG